jgi:signal transduction histidine kinase
MLVVSKTKRTHTSVIEIKDILDQINIIQETNQSIRRSFETISNDTVLQNFQKIDDTINNLQSILKQGEINQRTVSNKPKIKMTDESLLDILNQSIPRKMSSKITIHLPEQDITIKGIHYRLIVLFSNLIENSIQAMNNRGSIFITADTSENHTTIHVEDTGPGIPEKIKDKLFVKMITSKPKGSGLGTSMVKSIVDIHEGEISVTNNPTVFTIKLPHLQ